MSLSGPDWIKLNRLLDEALDLEPAKRSGWMESLPPEYESVRETLRELLFRKAGPETAEVLRRAPAFPTDQFLPVNVGDLVGPYRLLRQIGAGGMSTVWLAERADGSLQRQVALKLPRLSWIDRDLAARLDRERDILASLEHPGIARLYDAGVDSNSRPYLALEYVDGTPLDRYVAENLLSIPQRLEMFVQVARAVGYAHSRLIVHRDLKPTNVLVRSDGDVRLLDFGIAGLLHAGQSTDAKAHQKATRALTPRYAAPEQFAGEPATVATDIYSLGVMLYELLAGRSPYRHRPRGKNTGDDEILCLDPVPIVSVVDAQTARIVSGDLESILRKALHHDPRDRYASIGELVDDVQRYRTHLPVLSHPTSFSYRAKKFTRRHAIAVGMGAALSLAIVVGASVSLWQAQVAIRERDRALRLFEEAEATKEFWSMLFTEGVTNEETISLTQLLERAEQMTEEAAGEAPLQYSMAIDSIAGMYISNGLTGKAEALLERAIERGGGMDSSDPRTQSLQCKYAMAIAYRGEMQQAEAILSRVIDSAGDEPDLKRYCLHRRSIVARDVNDAARSLTYIQEAQQIAASLPGPRNNNFALLLGDLAYAYSLNGEMDLAQRYFKESMQLFRKLGREESHVALTVVNNWGVLDTSMGNPVAALEHIEQAIQIAKHRSPAAQLPPYLLANRGAALFALGRYDEALQVYQAFRERSIGDVNPRFEAYAVAGLAEVYLARGEVARARELLHDFKVEERLPVLGASPAAMRLRVAQGKVLTRQGNLEQAHQVLSRTIEAFDKAGAVTGGRAMPLIARAEVSIARNRPADALSDSSRAVDMAKLTRGANPFSNVLGLSLLVHAQAQLAQGDRSGASVSLRTAAANLKGAVGKDHPDTRRAEELLSELSSMT